MYVFMVGDHKINYKKINRATVISPQKATFYNQHNN